MSRVKRGVTTHARHRKVIKAAKGSRGRSKNTFRAAIQRVEKNLQYAYRDRRTRKRDFRRLWIQRINAASRQHGMTYAVFINGIKKAGIDLDRKVLSELAISEPQAFQSLVEQAQAAVEAGADIVLLDNMSCDQIREAIKLIDGRSKTEASGGVTLETVREIAETGVDFISVGALTHSAPSVDIALDFDPGA